MRFGILYEYGAGALGAEGADWRSFENTLEQIEIADEVGVDSVWTVDRHFDQAGPPELFLAAASQRTGRIRLGHGIVQLPQGETPPARVAERIATLDLLSGGRVDFGTGEGIFSADDANDPSGTDRRPYGGDRRWRQWEDAIDATTRMFVESPFAGWNSEWMRIPVRNVVPKPIQKPHPPLWMGCRRRETVRRAALRGLGALWFSPLDSKDARSWAAEYYGLIESDACVPSGFAVNPTLTIVRPLPVEDDPDTLRVLALGYEAAGVDQICFSVKPGMIHHDLVCATLERFGEEVLPEFADRAGRREAAKRERLAPAIERALGRRLPLRQVDPARTEESGRRVDREWWQHPPIGWVFDAIEGLKVGARQGVRQILRVLDDQSIEWLFGPVVQRAVLGAMACAFDPRRANGFRGDIVWELRSLANGASHNGASHNGASHNGAQHWTIRVDGGRATLRAGDSTEARARLRLGAADFLRVVAGEMSPAHPIRDGRMRVEGDLAAAMRLVEMFGGESGY